MATLKGGGELIPEVNLSSTTLPQVHLLEECPCQAATFVEALAPVKFMLAYGETYMKCKDPTKARQRDVKYRMGPTLNEHTNSEHAPE